jgi:hypothetical protein
MICNFYSLAFIIEITPKSLPSGMNRICNICPSGENPRNRADVLAGFQKDAPSRLKAHNDGKLHPNETDINDEERT